MATIWVSEDVKAKQSSANGKRIGEGRVEKTAGYKYSLYEGQDIGEVNGSPVDFLSEANHH